MSQFHYKHGRSIKISDDGRTATKNTRRFGSNWVYSRRDVSDSEIVCIRISDLLEKDNKRHFEIGLTDEDPVMMPNRPKTSYHLCNSKIHTPSYSLTEGALLILFYDASERLVYFGINGILKGVSSLYGLQADMRWLAIKIDATVKSVQIHETPDAQWNSFVLETARICKIFKDMHTFNMGATGLRQNLLQFHRPNNVRGLLFDGSKVRIDGNAYKAVTLFTNRTVLLNEIVNVKISRVCYGTKLTIFAYPYNPYDYNYNVQRVEFPSIDVNLTRDESIHLICTENGVLIQGRSTFVQASTTFYPVAPTVIGFRILSPKSFIELEFENPHALPSCASVSEGYHVKLRDSINSSIRPNSLTVRSSIVSSNSVENSILCKVCCVAKMDTLLTPCHHISMCAECTRKVMEGNNWKCPICLNPIDGFMRVNT